MPEQRMGSFATNIMRQKYSKTKADGSKETWAEIAERVAKNVLRCINASPEQVKATTKIIAERKFIPGGRYLYASGNEYHQVQNCLLMRVEDSREGWGNLLNNAMTGLMSGAGIGVNYSKLREEGAKIRRTGGVSSGPIALMIAVNEVGRASKQGGDRRAAIWAGLNWQHPDIFKFIELKNWSPEVRALKEKDFNFPAPMDGTNISVGLDTVFFTAYHDKKHPLHRRAVDVYRKTVRQMLKTGEPGFSIDIDENEGEDLRNAPVCGDTLVLTDLGYMPVSWLVGSATGLWTGLNWSPAVKFYKTKSNAPIVRVDMTGGRSIRCDESHPFLVERYKGKGKYRKLIDVERIPANKLKVGDVLHVSLPEAVPNQKLGQDEYVLGYVYGDGTFTEAGGAEVTFCTEESKRCVAPFRYHFLLSSVNEDDSRGYKRAYLKVDSHWQGRDKSVFPTEVYGWNYNQAGSFLAGLFDADGNWEPTQKRLRLSSKHEGFLQGVARLLEQYGILAHVGKSGTSTYGKSQGYQLVVASEYTVKCAAFLPTLRLKSALEGYESYRSSLVKVLSVEEDGVEDVYCTDVQMPEHSFQAEGVIISNCTEVSSRDDSDICNLGSINMAQIASLEEMESVVSLATEFLVAGTLYSDLPYPKVGEIREKNRRLGLGLMGLHEWLLQHGYKYGPCDELAQYLDIYAKSGLLANNLCSKLGISQPVKTRAIAPTGTIGIIAETTTGLEPIFCVAYKRRYLKGTTQWAYEYVVDPAAKRLVDAGVNPELIEDAYDFAEQPERRVAFQAWLQGYVDHSISSTLNIPSWGSEHNNDEGVIPFGDMLMKYLPKLRGMTVYPDGARGGQPLTPVKLSTALKHGTQVFYETADICEIGRGGGSCGA